MGREQPLPENLAERDFLPVLCEKTKIVSEIAARILELREIAPVETAKLLHRWLEVWKISPKLFDLLMETLSGDRSETKSFSEKAAENLTSKQNEKQTLDRELSKLRDHFPAIADELQKAVSGKSSPNNQT